MLISFKELFQKYSIKCHGLVHVGAHFAEENSDYLELGIQRRIYVEPCKAAFDVLLDKFENDIDVTLYNVACGDYEGVSAMFVSHNNQGQSNSLLRPDKHLEQHPDVVFTDSEIVNVVKLDNLDFKKKDYNFLVMDCQGFEGQVLLGATETLKHIDYIYTEVNRDSTYKDNFLVEQLDELLSDFKRVETFYPSPNLSWGDAFFISKRLL